MGTEATLCEGEDFLTWDEFQAKLSDLGLALEANNVPLIRTLLKDGVPVYQPDGDVVDWVCIVKQ